jgi:hypothetical protein
MAAAFVVSVLPASAQERPAGRACHAATATQSGIVIWGGAAQCGTRIVADSSRWLWDGTKWHRLQGPPLLPREDALLLQGAADSALVLLGGRRNGEVFDDVWYFDGRSWREASSAGGPGPIQHGAAAYDPLRKRVVVFGGALGRDLRSRTYEWDGTRWYSFDATGPAPRVGHGMAWSNSDGGILLYGGFAENQFRDLWKWDGLRWQKLADQGPTVTEGHVVAEADSGVYVVGPGLGDASTIRVWRWYRESFSLVAATGPPLRVGATATYDRRRRVLLYWGGSGGTAGPSATVFEFDGVAWR